MKRKKLKFMDLGGNTLSRREMKSIMAGSGGGGCGSCTITCQDGSQSSSDDCNRSTVEDECGEAVGATCAGPSSECDPG